MEIEAHKGHRTGHLAVEAPTIHAEAGVASFDRHLGHDLHVPALASTSHPMHHEQNWEMIFLPAVFKLISPVQTNVPTIREKYFLPLVFGFDVLRKMLVYRLKSMMKKVWSWLVDVWRVDTLLSAKHSQTISSLSKVSGKLLD